MGSRGSVPLHIPAATTRVPPQPAPRLDESAVAAPPRQDCCRSSTRRTRRPLRRRDVEPVPGRPDRRVVVLRPRNQSGGRLQHRSAQRRQPAFHLRRPGREHVPGDEAVALEVVQRLDQHPLGDVAHAPAERFDAARPFCQRHQDEHGPLIAEPVQHVADRAGRRLEAGGCQRNRAVASGRSSVMVVASGSPGHAELPPWHREEYGSEPRSRFFPIPAKFHVHPSPRPSGHRRRRRAPGPAAQGPACRGRSRHRPWTPVGQRGRHSGCRRWALRSGWTLRPA